LVSDPRNRNAFALNLVNLIERYGFDGVNIDIEDVFIEDSDNLSLLYTEISEVLRPRGYFFSASVPSRVSDEPFNPFSDPFNYSVIGRAVDEFVVMLYNEFGWREARRDLRSHRLDGTRAKIHHEQNAEG